MNKPIIINELAERVGCKKKDSRKMLECFQKLVVDALMRGDTIRLSGFGQFEIRIIPPHVSGLTKQHVDAVKIPIFKPSQKFKNHIINSSFAVDKTR
ncbi:MAG: DNA-binding protein HU [Pelotomaculum sp. PtaB.Bin104]|nr:MAG: DNA-binding protein HU [Pelotomaculum sp. PtaB.Bin104]